MSRIPSPKAILILIGVIGGTLAFAVWFYSRIVPDTAETVQTAHGTARLLALAFSLVAGVVLIVLMVVSHRRGYDDNLARRREAPPPDR